MGALFGKIFPTEEYDEYSQTTADATATTVASVSVAEGQTVLILLKAVAKNADLSKNGTFYMASSFYRASAGNVTALGTTGNIVVETTAGSTIDVTIVANTSTQAIDIKVAGETSETFNWDVYVSSNILS